MSDQRTPQSEPAGSDDKFVKRLVLINPVRIEDYWEKDAEPHHYDKEWHFLSLHLREYRFIRCYRSMTPDVGDIFAKSIRAIQMPVKEDPELDRLFRQAFVDFDSLSEDDKSKIRWAHLEEVQPHERKRTLRLEGSAELDRGCVIDVLSVGTKDSADTLKYREKVRRVQVSIHEAEKDAVGQLMHWTMQVRLLDGDLGEDYLVAQMYVKDGTLAELERDIRKRGGKIPIGINVAAHLFQHQFDGYDDRYQNYCMVYGSQSSLCLDSICVGDPFNDSADDIDEGPLEDESQGQPSSPETDFQESELASVVSNFHVSLRHMTIALWVLVIVILLSIFV